MLRTTLLVCAVSTLFSCGGPGGGGQSACPALTGSKAAGTRHGDITMGSETWKAADSPHIVSHFGGTIQQGDTVTIEPCALVVMQPSTDFDVQGKLVARGTADQPIVFDWDGTEEWGVMKIDADNVENPQTIIDLAYATLRHGGHQDLIDNTANFWGGVMSVRGGDSQLTGAKLQPVLRVEHVVIEDTPDRGLFMEEAAAFTADSTDLTIRRATRGVAQVALRAVSSLPKGSYDAPIVVSEANTEHGAEAYTFHNYGAPYVLGTDSDVNTSPYLLVGDIHEETTPGGSLTLEPGVTLKMHGDWTIEVRGPSVLTAQGTADKPIVLTSDKPQPAAGDWSGLFFRSNGAGSVLDHVTIAYAGAEEHTNIYVSHCEPDGSTVTHEDAAIIFGAQPASRFISHTTISDSAGYGINELYYGMPVDFVATNTFANVALCKQTTPAVSYGMCPANVTCPP